MKQNINLSFNHLRLKLLYKTIKSEEKISNKIILSIYLYKLKSFNDIKILESLFLLEYITNIKSHIASFNKSYQRLDLHLQAVLRYNHIFDYQRIIKVFYSPMLKRSGNAINVSYTRDYNVCYQLDNLNYLPMLPEAFLQHNITLYNYIYFKTKSKLESLLLLNYLTGL